MKKLFILSFMLCLLGGNRAWAGNFFYFTGSPQLNYGSTSFDYFSVELKKNMVVSTNQVNFPQESWDGTYSEDFPKSSFSGLKANDKIQVFGVITNTSNNQFTLKNPSINGNEQNNWAALPSNQYASIAGGTGAISLTQEDVNVILQHGVKIQGYGFNMTSVEYVSTIDNSEKSSFIWYAEPSNGITINGGFSSKEGNKYTLNNTPSQFSFSGTGYIIITCRANNYQNSGNGYEASFLITVLEQNQKKHWDFNKHSLSAGGVNWTGYNWRLACDNKWHEDVISSSLTVRTYTDKLNGDDAKYALAELDGLYVTTTGVNQFSVKNDASSSDPNYNRYIAVKPNVEIKIPNLSAGDRVRMLLDKNGTDMHLAFTNAKDALGKVINSDYIVGGSSDTKNNKLSSYYDFIVNQNGDFVFKQTSNDCHLMMIYDIEVYTGDYKMSNSILSNNKEYTPVTLKGNELDHNPEFHFQQRGKGEPNIMIDRVISTGTLNLTKSDFIIEKKDPSGEATTDDHVYLKSSSIKDKFGAFKLRMGVKDGSGNYVTNYSERIMSVGYYEHVGHPYTWDFTDIKRFSSGLMDNDYSNYHNHNVNNPENAALYDIEDMNNWQKDGGDYTFTHSRSNPDGAPFAWGSQLYAYNEMIPEVRGIAFTPVHMTDGTIALTNEGLKIESPWDDPYAPSALDGGNVAGMALFSDGYKNDSDEKMRIWETPWTNFKNDSRYPKPLYYDQAVADKASYETNDPRFGWKLTVYDVPNQTAIYIRVKTIAGKKPKLRFDFIRTGNLEVDGEQVPRPDPTVGWNFFKRIIDNGDGTFDIIVGMSPTQSASQQPIHFILNNVIVERIATSKDIKYIGQTGHATESRFRTIDHRLNEYFSNEPIKAYQGKFSSDYSQLILKEVEIMEKATEDNQPKYGTVLIHSAGIPAEGGFTNKTVNVIDGGFHMFVPDMHDYKVDDNVQPSEDEYATKGYATKGYNFEVKGADDISENVLISKAYDMNVGAYISNGKDVVAPFGDDAKTKTNLVLSAKRYTYGGDGTNNGNGYDVFFVRVDPSKAGASVPGYSSYIQIPTEKMKELTSNNGGNAKMSIVFEDELFGNIINEGIATGITDVTQQNAILNSYWYTLDGRKLNGIPTEKGLYIMNGKKVMVK